MLAAAHSPSAIHRAGRASCIELGSRRRIFKSGISSGSPDPEIGVSCRSLGALGPVRKRCRRDRRRRHRNAREPLPPIASGLEETRGEQKGWEREKEVSLYGICSFYLQRKLSITDFLTISCVWPRSSSNSIFDKLQKFLVSTFAIWYFKFLHERDMSEFV